jgi:hypothetical protein
VFLVVPELSEIVGIALCQLTGYAEPGENMLSQLNYKITDKEHDHGDIQRSNT